MMVGRRGTRIPVSVYLFAIVLLASNFNTNAWGHDGVTHKTQEEAQRHRLEKQNTTGFPNIKGGDFNLIDQDGMARTSKNPNGQYQLLFFGYASCKAICSVALPRMAAAVDLLEDREISITAALITIDPERDTLAKIGPAIKKIHPKMIGLTGSHEQLDKAYKAFQIERSLVFIDPDSGPIYSHGSFIYLLAPDGSFKTLLPPIVSAERIVKMVLKYIQE